MERFIHWLLKIDQSVITLAIELPLFILLAGITIFYKEVLNAYPPKGTIIFLFFLLMLNGGFIGLLQIVQRQVPWLPGRPIRGVFAVLSGLFALLLSIGAIVLLILMNLLGESTLP